MRTFAIIFWSTLLAVALVLSATGCATQEQKMIKWFEYKNSQ